MPESPATIIPSLTLTNKTLLRAYLAHIQSQARHAAALHHERMQHPDSRGKGIKSDPALSKTWNLLSRQLVQVLGPEAELKPYGQIVKKGSFSRFESPGGRDPFRITMKALKLKADKARRKYPKLTLLKQWDLAAKEPAKEATHA